MSLCDQIPMRCYDQVVDGRSQSHLPYPVTVGYFDMFTIVSFLLQVFVTSDHEDEVFRRQVLCHSLILREINYCYCNGSLDYGK